MGKGLLARCFGPTKAFGEAESSFSSQRTREISSAKPQLELLELTGTDIASRMRSIKQAARLTKKIQNLQSTWLEVTQSGPQPMSPSSSGTKVTVLRGHSAGVIEVPIETAEPSDSIKAGWDPEIRPSQPEERSQFEENASTPIPTAVQAEVAAERAVTEALAKDMSWYQTVIDNPLAGSKSLGGSTNTSPGGPSNSGPGLRQAILARSASQALAAQAAAAALRRQTSTQSSLNTGASLTPKPSGAMTPQTSLQLSPLPSTSLAGLPTHATHTYTPGSFTHSQSLSRDGQEAVSDVLGGDQVTLYSSPPLTADTQNPPAPQIPGNSIEDGGTPESKPSPAVVEEPCDLEESKETVPLLQQAETERQYDKQERWQLPGLTGNDALQPGEWQSFCTKVDTSPPHTAQDMETQDALRDSSNFSNGEASSAVQTEAAAQQAYVQSLVKRFEKSVGPSWPSRVGMRQSVEKENAEQVYDKQAETKYLVFTPAEQEVPQ